MKNFTNNFKQFTSRLSARWLIMALMLLLGTSSAWGWSISANRNVYLYDATTTCNVKLQVWANNSWDNTHNMTKLGNGVYQYKVGSDGYKNYSGFQFIKDCSTKSYVGPFYQDINSVNSCRYSDSWSFPPVWSLTIANNGTNVSKGGSGTKADPYLVPENSTVKVKVSSVGYEQNGLGIRYSWKSTGSATSYTANDTEDSFTIGAAGTVVGVVCDAKTEYGNNLCSVGCSSNTIYFKSYTACIEATLEWADTFDGSMKVADVVTTPASLDNEEAANSISYTSSNPDVISVNGTTLTALKSGKATITASATPKEGFCNIKSIEKEVTVTCDVVNTEDIKIEVVYTGDGIPSIWAWEPNNSNNNLTGGKWPGQAMTPEGNNVYSWKTKPTSGESVSIIISGGNKQTVDIDGLQIGKRYKFKYDPTNGECDDKGKLKKDLLEEDCLAPACTNPAVPSIKINENSSATICDGSTARITIDANHEAASYKLFTKNGDTYKDEKDINNKTIDVSTAGTYVVRAYNATCMTESEAVTLSVDTKPTITVSEISPICAGNEIDLSKYVSASLGTLTYNGETTSKFNPIEETVYTIVAINGECSVTETITVPVTSIPETPSISSEQASICSGSQATINIEGDAKTYLLYVHDNGYTLQGNIKPDGKTFKITPKKTTTYAVKALNGESCYSTDFSNDVTINVTTTPVITGPSATQPNKEIRLSSEAGANTKWETTSGSTLTPETGAETVFTATENGNYTITAKNTANNITCSATHPIVVNDKFYIYIRRPKSGTTTYDQWYEKTNDADKGAHPWMKNGSEYKTGDDDYTNNNYDGNGPESTFTDCNGYVWDAFIAPGTSFFIHAPNTFQEGGQEGYATFTQVTNITSTATDLYYTINQWAGGETKGTTLSPASEPNRIPEVAVPVLSIDPVSGIICQGAEATITVTNPENGVSYKLNYEGKDQTNSIAYTGTENVKFAVTESGTYLVKAETTNGTCKGNAVSIAREIQVITTSISFEGAPYVTTPWEPITITVNIPKGYNYTFNDTQLTQIASPDTPIKKVSGSEYTYSFPRPQEWGTGNSQTGDSWGEKTYTISATLNGVTETCGTTTATVKLQDEGNDKCRTNP